MGWETQNNRLNVFKIEFRPRPPPDPAAHAHTAVSAAGSQKREGQEPVEQAVRDARYRVVAEVPGRFEGAVQRVEGRTECDSA